MRLNDSHKDQIRDLIESNMPRVRNGYAVNSAVPHLQSEYLGANSDRMLFGSFDGDELVAIAGLRTNYPSHKQGIVCNFFATPRDISPALKVKAVDQVYEYAMNNGIHTLYSNVMAERLVTQTMLGTKYGPHCRVFNTMRILEYVRAGEKPSQEWMFVLMGMRTSPCDIAIRAITYDGGESYNRYLEER